MSEKEEKLTATIEAILFAYGEALSIKRLGEVIGISEEKIEGALKTLGEVLEDRGLGLIENRGAWQLVTRPEERGVIEKLVKDDFGEALTAAALETLTIVTYLSPVSRAQIDFVRGVNSAFILRNLMLRGLIDRRTDKKRSYVQLYEPTNKLLKYLGVTKVSELEDYETYHNLLEAKANNEKEG